MRTHMADECKNDYAAQLQKYNKEQNQFYYSEIPSIFNVSLHTHTHTCTCTHIHTLTYTRLQMHTCTHAHAHTRTHTHMHTHMQIHTQTLYVCRTVTTAMEESLQSFQNV